MKMEKSNETGQYVILLLQGFMVLVKWGTCNIIASQLTLFLTHIHQPDLHTKHLVSHYMWGGGGGGGGGAFMGWLWCSVPTNACTHTAT